MATALDVITDVGAKLNDPSLSVYTSIVQLPFVGMANRELQILLELNGIPHLKDRSAAIAVLAGVTDLAAYPSDFIEPISLGERAFGTTDRFVDMSEVEWAPDEAQTDWLRYWTFQDGVIRFLGALVDREVKLKYRRTLNALTVEGSNVEIADAQPWLAARVAQMVEQDVMNSPTKASLREPEVIRAKDDLIRKLLKNTQALGVRRRPYKGSGRRIVT